RGPLRALPAADGLPATHAPRPGRHPARLRAPRLPAARRHDRPAVRRRMRPARLLFNPAAGGPGGERVLARLVAELTPAFTLRTVATASPGECRQEAAAAAAAGEEVVFVLGGDGTLRQAAS